LNAKEADRRGALAGQRRAIDLEQHLAAPGITGHDLAVDGGQAVGGIARGDIDQFMDRQIIAHGGHGQHDAAFFERDNHAFGVDHVAIGILLGGVGNGGDECFNRQQLAGLGGVEWLHSQSAYQKAAAMGIGRVYQPACKAANMGFTADFRDHRVKFAHLGLADHFAAHARADNGLIDKHLARAERAPRIQLREPPGGAGAGGRAIHLAVGKNAAIGLICVCAARRAIDDGAVDMVEFGDLGVDDRIRGIGGLFDLGSAR